MENSRTKTKETLFPFKGGDKVFIHDFLTGSYEKGWVTIETKSGSLQLLSVKNEHGKEISFNFSDFLKIASFTEYTLKLEGFSQARPKPKKKNGDPFEVGDRIWVIDLKGVREVEVHKIRNDETYYKLIIDMGIHNYERFTIDGRYDVDKPVVLFHQKPVITFED